MAGNVRQLPSRKDTSRKKHGRWQARITGTDGRRYNAPKTFPTKVAAISWVAEQERNMALGVWEPPAVLQHKKAQERVREQITVAVWLQQWLDRQTHLRESSKQRYERTITNRITATDNAAIAEFANTSITKVNRAAVYAWWDAITNQFPTPQTNRKAHIYLRAAFNDAVDRDLIPANPVNVKAARAKPEPKEKQLPATETLQAIVEAAPARYRFIFALCLFMGLRVGEAIGLQRKHLRNDGTTTKPEWVVEIRGNMQRLSGDNGVYMKWQPPKTKAGRRDVPIFDRFNPIVAEHLEHFATGGEDDFLTITQTGAPVMDTSLRSMMERACVKAGFAKKEVTPHYGRNWLITHLAELGATPAEIGYLLGQSDLKTITEIYMKVRPDNLGKVMGRLNGLLSGEVVTLAEKRLKLDGQRA